jgi:sugar phosphate isomerase/epimerase
VGLSTSSVFPESTPATFEIAKKLGFECVEIMVGTDGVSTDIDAVRRMSEYYELPVAAIHAPCLILTAAVWGTDPWEKLRMSLDAAKTLGAGVVVVHPPFRWQGDYASNFVSGVRQLEQDSGMVIAVENMYPWRTPIGIELRAYSPDWDPTDIGAAHLCLDLSHASTARQSSLRLIQTWGPRLAHVHLTDGTGMGTDDHLLPGKGDQQAGEVLATLARQGYDKTVILEVSTSTASNRIEREAMLAECLAFAREHLAVKQ